MDDCNVIKSTCCTLGVTMQALDICIVLWMHLWMIRLGVGAGQSVVFPGNLGFDYQNSPVQLASTIACRQEGNL